MPSPQEWEISTHCATPVEVLESTGLDIFTAVVDDFSVDEVSPETMTKLHRTLRREALAQADRAFGRLLVWLFASTNLDRLASQAIRDIDERRLVNKGLNTVSVQLPSGVEVPLRATYLLHQPKRKAGRSKRHGNRGEEGAGCYPALEAVGIDSHRQLSPLTEEAILYTGTACDDFRTGWEMAHLFDV